MRIKLNLAGGQIQTWVGQRWWKVFLRGLSTSNPKPYRVVTCSDNSVMSDCVSLRSAKRMLTFWSDWFPAEKFEVRY